MTTFVLCGWSHDKVWRVLCVYSNVCVLLCILRSVFVYVLLCVVVDCVM